MAGKQVPIVFIPRWTTVVGAGTFYWPQVPIAAYESLVASLVVGNILGTNPTVIVALEESIDGNTWLACEGGFPVIPTAFNESQYTTALTKAWLRARVTLSGTSPAITCALAGSLTLRER